MVIRRWILVATAVILCAGLGQADAVLASPYSNDYTLTTYSSPSGVPGNLGGVTFLNSSTLLLGGAANGAEGAIYSVPVIRDSNNQITGFGAGTLYGNAPYIDGGLAFGPSGTLFFTEYPNNEIGEITEPCTPTCSVADTEMLAGVASSVGTLGIVPTGFSGAGNFVIGSYSGGEWYTAALTPNGPGTYSFSATQTEDTGGGPEGIVWVPAGNPDFSVNSSLISLYSNGGVDACATDASGTPDATTCTPFIVGLSGAEGAVIDPLTGDFVFSTFGSGNQLVVVSGFTAVAGAPEPGAAALMAFGLGVAGLLARRRKAGRRSA